MNEARALQLLNGIEPFNMVQIRFSGQMPFQVPRSAIEVCRNDILVHGHRTGFFLVEEFRPLIKEALESA